MTGYIGCLGLLGIAVFIALLYVRRRKIENEMTEFYKENLLYATENCPPNVRESLGASDNLYCCPANLITTKGEKIEFGWWEWYIKSNAMVNGTPTVSFDYYLAVSFAPNAVSREFAEQAIRLTDKSGDDFSKKAKDFFVINTDTPYRAELLADGSLIICWRVLKRRDIYDAKIAWLKNNVVPLNSAENAPSATIDAVPPVESKNVEPEAVETDSGKTTGAVFYRHDNYAALRYSFSSVWSNLDLEIHRFSNKFDKEGYDEYESDANFNDRSSPNDTVFTLTGETTAREAQRLFEEFFGGHAYILRGGNAVEKGKTLADCNQP